MKIVALVPIKLNNERLKNKNILELEEGKPLLTYVLNTLANVKYIDEAYVYCSDEVIKDFLPEHIIFKKRSQSLDSNTTTINEILESFTNEVDADVYLLTHATSPFISVEKINQGIEAVLFDSYDSAFSVEELKDFVWYKNKPLNYCLENVPRTQDLEAVYRETSGFYIFKKEVFLKNRRRIGDRPLKLCVGPKEAIDIDEEVDFLLAKKMAKQNN
ncbi:MAG: acylneuraminate cytidylyltransferase family protein [Solibacillus sp.]